MGAQARVETRPRGETPLARPPPDTCPSQSANAEAGGVEAERSLRGKAGPGRARDPVLTAHGYLSPNGTTSRFVSVLFPVKEGSTPRVSRCPRTLREQTGRSAQRWGQVPILQGRETKEGRKADVQAQSASRSSAVSARSERGQRRSAASHPPLALSPTAASQAFTPAPRRMGAGRAGRARLLCQQRRLGKRARRWGPDPIPAEVRIVDTDSGSWTAPVGFGHWDWDSRRGVREGAPVAFYPRLGVRRLRGAPRRRASRSRKRCMLRAI